MTNPSPAPVLSLNGVSKSFAGKQAVRGVSFDVMPGSIVGFLGPNGAGKTTTLRMALGLINPNAGEIRLLGGAPGPQAFGRIGFLPEERGLYRKITARDAITHIARLNGMDKTSARAISETLLETYGLGDVKRKKIKTLSKGMAQKVQLLAAIAHDPEFLILDEPFSGLDPVNQKLLEDMIREISARGRTIIFSTHVMEHAERLCDQIVLMSGGAKIYDGDLEGALAQAPRRLVVATDGAGRDVFSKFAEQIDEPKTGEFHLILNDGTRAQQVLEAAVAAKIKLLRFEPERPSLHDAFVALVDKSKTEITA